LPFSLLHIPPPHTSSFLPYTTLFRSQHPVGVRRKQEDGFEVGRGGAQQRQPVGLGRRVRLLVRSHAPCGERLSAHGGQHPNARPDRKSTRLNSSHQIISYAVFCLKKK